jgi:hypothetical protein
MMSRRERDELGSEIVVITDPGAGGPTRYRVIGDQFDAAASKVTFTAEKKGRLAEPAAEPLSTA